MHGLLSKNKLLRYYDLAPGERAPAREPSTRDHKWLEPIEARLDSSAEACRVELDLQGLQCSACVWLHEELFKREPGALGITVNPALGKAELLVRKDFPLRRFVEELEAFGYAFGPSVKGQDGSSDLLLRLGVCAALAMNAMIFSLPLYLGLDEGPVHRAFRLIGLVLSTLSVLVGGTVFFRSAWNALRRGVLHLDVPIALGVLLAYGGSLWSYFRGDDRGTFFDTLSVFLALMLTGRFLQERVLRANRARLLADDGVESVLVRRAREGKLELVAAGEVRSGDRLFVEPGALCPVACEPEAERVECSLEWIQGESEPVPFSRGELLPAGAFNAGREGFFARAAEDFDASTLRSLLRGATRDHDPARSTVWWQRLSRAWTIGVLVTGIATFLFWLLRDGGGLSPALRATTAVLVVTCPCAFGLATPLAYELVQAGLRRAGLFVRSASFLDKAVAVRRVIFDKTGTLTTGALHLAPGASQEALASLSEEEGTVLYNLCVRSRHPKSNAVRAALEAMHPHFDESFVVSEQAGAGLEVQHKGARWRLGRSGWAATKPQENSADLVFTKDGAVLANFLTEETFRSDAVAEVRALERDGFEAWILSGDAQERVTTAAQRLGIASARALGSASPDEKARVLRQLDQSDTLMLGDGVNDAPAVAAAFCSGTPAIDRAFLPSRADFYFTTPGLHPVRLALRAAHALRRVHRRNLTWALAYNVLTVGLSVAGVMSPLLCAIVMPATSLTILLATAWSLGAGRSLWKSS